MTLLRRALGDVVGGIDWRWLGAAGLATIVGTFVLATVEPPTTVASLAFGALGATVMHALLARSSMRTSGAGTLDEDGAATAEWVAPDKRRPAPSADQDARAPRAEREAQPAAPRADEGRSQRAAGEAEIAVRAAERAGLEAGRAQPAASSESATPSEGPRAVRHLNVIPGTYACNRCDYMLELGLGTPVPNCPNCGNGEWHAPDYEARVDPEDD